MKWLLTFAIAFNTWLWAISAQTYCVLDRHNLKIVHSRKHLQARAPASTIKLLTAMVVLDRIQPHRLLQVSKFAAGTAPSKIYLRTGERMSSRDLIAAMLLKSANDAAVVLAEGVATTTTRFSRLMNNKARKIGCRNSCFVTPNGLPAKGQYSCAYDLALIAAKASRYSLIRSLLTKKKIIVTTRRGRKIAVYSHNRMLSRQLYGKTGWTRKARNTFAGFAAIDGNQAIALAVMGSPRRSKMWNDLRSLLNNPTQISRECEIQVILKRLGYYHGKIDGIIGPKSRAAIKAFQRKHRLKVDGIVGKNTWRALQKYR